eukprot:scaffold23151_cov35-Tisochrysis_lutea.AAC.4
MSIGETITRALAPSPAGCTPDSPPTPPRMTRRKENDRREARRERQGVVEWRACPLPQQRAEGGGKTGLGLGEGERDDGADMAGRLRMDRLRLWLCAVAEVEDWYECSIENEGREREREREQERRTTNDRRQTTDGQNPTD